MPAEATVAAAAAAAMLQVEVVFCARPGAVDSSTLALPPGATLADALQASGVLARHALSMQTLQAGVWSQRQPLDTLLRSGDRVEVYRALVVDPKAARRLRQQLQRVGAAAR